MAKLPILSGKEIGKLLERLGFIRLHRKGSHVSFKRETAEGVRCCVIPMHKEVAIGTLRGILRQAHITEEDFLKEYGK